MALLTREQLEERLALLHRTSLELVSDLTLETLLKKVVSLARDEVNAKYAALGVLDERGDLSQFIPVGMTQEEINIVGKFPSGKGLIGALKNEGKTIRIRDISKDERSIGFPQNHPCMDSFLGVPIKQGEKILGQIYLTNKIDLLEFTKDDEQVIEMLAAYAAVAINNARMYEAMVSRDEALIQQNEELSFLNDIATALADSSDVDEIIERTLARVISYLRVESGEIYLLEDGVKEVVLKLHQGNFNESFFIHERIPLGEGIVGNVIENGKPYVNYKLQEESHYINQNLNRMGYRGLICLPISARGTAIGVLCLAKKDDEPFTVRQIALLNSVVNSTGITIENAFLHNQAQRLAVLEERQRIGMDLHDGIIQSIYAVGLALDYARVSLDDDIEQTRNKIEQAIDGLNKTIRDLRAYILDLRPRELVGNDLIKNLQRLVDEYRINTLSEASLIGPDDGLAGIPTSHSTALFHICQEALANTAKHSKARKVDVRLWTTRERVLLEVADNGTGFDLHKMSITLGHGLSNMHIRARKVGGDVEISSAPGEGATVLAWVPRRA